MLIGNWTRSIFMIFGKQNDFCTKIATEVKHVSAIRVSMFISWVFSFWKSIILRINENWWSYWDQWELMIMNNYWCSQTISYWTPHRMVRQKRRDRPRLPHSLSAPPELLRRGAASWPRSGSVSSCINEKLKVEIWSILINYLKRQPGCVISLVTRDLEKFYCTRGE